MNKQINILFLLLNILIISCRNEMKLNNEDTKLLLANNSDTVIIGKTSLKKDLFDTINKKLYPDIKLDGIQPYHALFYYYEIEGIYINSNIFNCFNLKNGVPKINNVFDVIYIYPEISRYNFQFSDIVDYRIIHYNSYFYRQRSSSENLPYYIKEIIAINKNQIMIIFQDKSNYIDNDFYGIKNDTLYFSTYPSLKMDFNIKKAETTTNKYFKLAEGLGKVNLTTQLVSLPQDINELYINEVITKLINLRYGTNYEFNDIAE